MMPAQIHLTAISFTNSHARQRRGSLLCEQLLPILLAMHGSTAASILPLSPDEIQKLPSESNLQSVPICLYSDLSSWPTPPVCF